jgi:RNA polymerase sigma-70 factor (ECF subfamily)
MKRLLKQSADEIALGSLQPASVPAASVPDSKLKPSGLIAEARFAPDSMDSVFGVEDSHEVDDESLVQAYLEDRCTEAFEKIVRRYERELYTFLRRFLGDAQAAEDVFQATFLSVHLRIEQFERGRRFRPWLYAIASNKAIDFMRRNKRHQIGSLNAPAPSSEKEEALIHKLPGHEEMPDALAVSRETSGRVRMALQQLNEPTQELLHLAFYQGMKYADIAEMLQIPLGTVKSRVFTAIRKLNAIWMRMEEGKGNNQE